MGIYFSSIRSILEVKRKVNGQDEDLDNEEENTEQDNTEENNDEGNQDDEEHMADNSASDYSMEVDDEDSTEEPEESNDDNEQDTSDNGSSDGYTMDVEDDTSSEENNEDDEHDSDNSSSDYSMDMEDDNEESGDEENNDGNEEENNSEEDDNVNEDELKTLQDDIFKDVPPEQMNIKIMELKKQYLEVYATITDVLTRTNNISKTTDNMKVVEFIINKLMELKDIVQFYLSNTFDTKTYVENMVNYQQYLATLNTINKLLKEINTKKENNS